MDNLLKNWLKKVKLNESLISTLLGAAVVVIVGVLIFNYFSKGQKPASQEELTVEEKETSGASLAEKELPLKHTVQPGENLWHLAVTYYQNGFQWTKIAEANQLKNPDIITVGQELTIPQIEITASADEEMATINGEKYVVKKGDSLWTIALRAYADPYQWVQIAEANQLTNPNLIHPGNEFVLPRGK